MQAPNIKFGTDGWRGIIADDFTFDNVALVGSAIRLYLEESGFGERALLIGYDRRFAAESYAAHLANHLVGLGQRVILMHEACPTPLVAFSVLHLQAAGAVMLTASHNPYYYQGLKFIPHFAGPAMPSTTDRITALINELVPGFTPPPLRLQWQGERVNLKDAYFEHIDSLVNTHSLTSGGWTVLYNPMHGVGANYLDDYLKHAGVPCITINAERDVYFGDCLPDPSPKNLQPLAPKLAELDCKILLATDGDSDRFGLVDTEGRYFGANQALPLLADYLIRYKHMTGDLIRTVSTSHMLDAVAKEHGLKLVETAVGFKYVGEAMQHGGLIGGEESGGLSIQGHVPEKDGILASLLMLEMAATSGDDWHTLLRNLQKRLGARAYVRIDEELSEERKQRLMAGIKAWPDSKFAGKRIDSRNAIDGMKFIFDDGSWVLMRPSGTEPLVRVYIETTAPEMMPKFTATVLEAVKELAG